MSEAMTAGPVIKVEGLSFEYPGRRALDAVSADIPRGSITALVGPNGAGKTTLIKCIAALQTPLAGRVTVDGVDVHEEPRLAHRNMGHMADFFGLYDTLTVRQCLRYRAAAQAIPAAEQPAAVESAAARAGLTERLEQKAGELSRGYRQRLALAQAIIHRPAVLLLDEPASGLDPAARNELSRLLLNLRDDGATIIVSSHILAELEDYSTHILIVDNGRIVEHRAIASDGAPGGRASMFVALAAPDERLADVLASAGAEEISIDGAAAQFALDDDAAAQQAVLKSLVEAGLPVCAFAPSRGRLQDLYLARLKAEGGTSC
jgi:ABC-2 type transport system ATP-binding protein